MTIDARCLADNTINIVTVSGGKDSLADWLLAIESGIPFRVVFADTGHEHPQTMDYLDYLENRLGNIIRVKADFSKRIQGKREFIAERWPVSLVEECGFTADEATFRIQRALSLLQPTGIPFLDLAMWKGRFPSTKAKFCTFELKHEPVKTQVVGPALNDFDEVVMWQGVRAQESPARAALSEWEEDADNTPGLHVYRPILQWQHEEVFAIAKRHGNLSIYFMDDAHRRAIIEEPKKDRIENYESMNIDYVVEAYAAGCLIENIKLGEFAAPAEPESAAAPADQNGGA